METFGFRLRKLRLGQELTQRALATKVGVTAPMVTQWENNLALPKTDNADRLCAILGTTWDYLKTGRAPEKGAAVRSIPITRTTPLLSKAEVVRVGQGEFLEGSDIVAPEVSAVIKLLGGSNKAIAFIEDSPGMIPRIMPGETVLIDPVDEYPTGEWAFEIGGEVVVGVVNKTPNGLILSFHNSTAGWESITVEASRSIGKVLASLPLK